ncbi:family 20 glycosylhydrolase [Phytomonospora endophytica]|uniref:F5/8 type C domain-containing protein n=1 Tax=Phytomonospora endophytica TaxID=714109 RepID=A0A841FXU4_9ACTN|nr:family 20 glycosylhydrolase [Phytomonospora endophytica]MBB6038177.1 hypothetical protein [Phytomonospora endophytica]GIG67362.1 hypothetical protein Pen01_36570 [Phytomonospora endophytica]
MTRARTLLTFVGAAVVLAAVLTGSAGAAEEADAANPAPPVVPALQQWTGGTGALELRPSTRVVAEDDALRPVAERLAADLAEITGWPTTATTGAARRGDIALDLDPTAVVGPGTALADREGYRLDTTGAAARVTARTTTAAYWGTRSVLQMLTRETPGTATLTRGLAVDWPNTEIRGFMLDVGRRWFGHEFLRDYVRYLSWFKLNTFQIHLNDNEISPPGGDWSQAYSAFRLASDDPRFAGLAATDGAFTRADWDRLEDVAADNFVTLVPEIDAPAHARSLIAFDPSLGLNGGNSDHLDLSKPATTAFMKEIYDEFAPWFRGPALHVGADEYPREYEPQYRAYVNDIAAHVRGLGKEVRAWGSLSVMAGGADGYDRDMTMHSWNNGWYGPKAAVADGYPVVNTNDAQLYIVPFADYYHGHGLDGRWLFDNWEPHVFPGGQSLTPGEPLLRGAMSAVWNDLVHADYDAADVHGLVEPTFGLLAQKMWRGTEGGTSYADFMADVTALGVGPGMETLTTTLPGAGDRRLDLTATALPPLIAGESATVTATVVNRSEHTLTGLKAAFDTEAEGLRVTPAGSRPKSLRAGESATLSWTVETDAATPTGAAKGRITVNGKLRGLTVAKNTGFDVRTIEAAPDGLRHLAFDATASASSVELDLDRLAPSRANDGDLGTRWASGYSDDEWLRLDLAAPSQVDSVRLFWESACATSYRVEVSTDAVTWTTAATVDTSSCGDETVALDSPDPVRHIRIHGTKRATTWGYSLHELWPFGTPTA